MAKKAWQIKGSKAAKAKMAKLRKKVGKGATKGRTKKKRTRGGNVVDKPKKKSSKPRLNWRGGIAFVANNVLLGQAGKRIKNIMDAEDKHRAIDIAQYNMLAENPEAVWINGFLIDRFGLCGAEKFIDKKIVVHKRSLAITYVCGNYLKYPWMTRKIRYAIKDKNFGEIEEIGTFVGENPLPAAVQTITVIKKGLPITYKGGVM